MKRIGAHVSISGGIFNAPKYANSIGAKAFGMFLKNQRRWESKPYNEEDIENFKSALLEFQYDPKYILPHDSYLINLGSPEKEKREKSLKSFIDEIKRCEQLGLLYLNAHPGSHLREISEKECMDYIAESINIAIDESEYLIIVLENTAGQGSNIGYSFEQLAYIINKIKNKKRIGVCLDTCHMFAAGYDIRDEKTYNETMEKFDKIIGFKYLKGVHLNDSMSELGSKKDRHNSIGKGLLGEEFFKLIMNDNRFDEIPIILETIDETIWEDEIEYLYGLIKTL
jgi:deoxyribonuclease-4